MNNGQKYNYDSSGQYPSSGLLFKTQRFGDRIVFPSSGGTHLTEMHVAHSSEDTKENH
jgi:hypothetical protein